VGIDPHAEITRHFTNGEMVGAKSTSDTTTCGSYIAHFECLFLSFHSSTIIFA
jgi:hypothetical protein